MTIQKPTPLNAIIVEVTADPELVDGENDPLALQVRFPHPYAVAVFKALVTDGISAIAEQVERGDQLLMTGTRDGDDFHAATVARVLGD